MCAPDLFSFLFSNGDPRATGLTSPGGYDSHGRIRLLKPWTLMLHRITRGSILGRCISNLSMINDDGQSRRAALPLR